MLQTPKDFTDVVVEIVIVNVGESIDTKPFDPEVFVFNCLDQRNDVGQEAEVVVYPEDIKAL